jgi:hypothetical protein
MITEPLYSVFHQSWAPQLPWDVPADANILSDKPVVPNETVKRLYMVTIGLICCRIVFVSKVHDILAIIFMYAELVCVFMLRKGRTCHDSRILWRCICGVCTCWDSDRMLCMNSRNLRHYILNIRCFSVGNGFRLCIGTPVRFPVFSYSCIGFRVTVCAFRDKFYGSSL